MPLGFIAASGRAHKTEIDRVLSVALVIPISSGTLHLDGKFRSHESAVSPCRHEEGTARGTLHLDSKFRSHESAVSPCGHESAVSPCGRTKVQVSPCGRTKVSVPVCGVACEVYLYALSDGGQWFPERQSEGFRNCQKARSDQLTFLCYLN